MKKIAFFFMAALTAIAVDAGNGAGDNVTSAPYKVGDYYNDGIKEGVVFFVSGDGMHGKIVSLDEGFCAWKSNDYIEKTAAATSRSDGRYNMDRVRQQPEWAKAFPSFVWCASLGSDWYLPAVEELELICRNKETVNFVLKEKGYSELYKTRTGSRTDNGQSGTRLVSFSGRQWAYWSSTECEKKSVVAFMVSINGEQYEQLAIWEHCVRAVAVF